MGTSQYADAADDTWINRAVPCRVKTHVVVYRIYERLLLGRVKRSEGENLTGCERCHTKVFLRSRVVAKGNGRRFEIQILHR